MAIAPVLTMVHQRLPFTSPSANDATIESIRVQMTYLMQPQTKKIDAEVEDELNYTPRENMLFAAMTAYQLVKSQVMLVLAGNGTTISGGAKILTKGKADVVEAEFSVAKSIDGSILGMTTTDWLDILLKEICAMGQMLGYNVPWCTLPMDIIPPFIVGCDYPPSTCCFPGERFLNGEPVGY